MNKHTSFKYPTAQPCVLTFPPLHQGRFIQRDNRFRISVYLEEDQVTVAAHLANPGRLRELLVPDAHIWLSAATNTKRKTAYDAQLIEFQSHLVSLNSQLPNQLIERALTRELFTEFRKYSDVRREVTRGHSRFDFCLSNEDQRCWVEVKSVTLVENEIATFPDAPTERGRKHLLELIDCVGQGDQAAVLFVVQRSDAKSFSPHDATDPEFGLALRQAQQAGVRIMAITCEVSTQQIVISHPIPVVLDAPLA